MGPEAGAAPGTPLLGRPLRRIGVFRALHLGDLLCVVPALRALRAACPQAQITLIGLPWAQDFAERYARYVDDLLVYPCGEHLPRAAAGSAGFSAFVEQARARRFDLLIQLHGSGEASNALVARLGAAHLAGFAPARQTPMPPHFLPWPASSEPEVSRYLRLVQQLGAPDCGAQLEFPLSEAERHQATRLLDRFRLARGRYVCLHPGAKLLSRRWPVERFTAVAQRVLDAGWSVALTGSAGEAALTAAIAARLQAPSGRAVADLSGQTTLGSLAGVVARAALVVANDTGISHLAAALSTPSVIVSSGADAERWAPLDRKRHRVFWQAAACRPCSHDECPTGHACALGVSADRVAAAALAALGCTASNEVPHAA